MNKVIPVMLIAFGMIFISGSAMAWHIDIDAVVFDATTDISASGSDGETYMLGTTAGIDGRGDIHIDGASFKYCPMQPKESAWMTTTVDGEFGNKAEGTFYAGQYLGVRGCLLGCNCQDPCDPINYGYTANDMVYIEGEGEIFLSQGVRNMKFVFRQPPKIVNEQILCAHGSGNVMAVMNSTQIIEDNEPNTHIMSASGYNVGFNVFGTHGMNIGNGANYGFFTAGMYFYDPPCPGPIAR